MQKILLNRKDNHKLEAAARGNGLDEDLQPLKGMSDRAFPVERSMTDRASPVARTMSDDELINKSIEFLTCKGFSVTI